MNRFLLWSVFMVIFIIGAGLIGSGWLAANGWVSFTNWLDSKLAEVLGHD